MSVISGSIAAKYGYNAAKKAANVQKEASKNALAEMTREYEQGRSDLAPWRTAGTIGLAGAQNILSGATDITKTPGYEFRLREGQNAIERSAAARGNVLGVRTMKELGRYGQDYASTERQNAIRDYLALAGLGEGPTSTGATLGANYGNNAANVLINAGNAEAGGIIGQSNQITGAIQNANATAQNALMSYWMWKAGK